MEPASKEQEVTSSNGDNHLLDNGFLWLQRLLPQHLLSHIAFRVARLRWRWWRRSVIPWFIRRYGVDMSAAEGAGWEDYPHFNAFFTRALKPGVRPMAESPDALVSPVDGVVYDAGYADHNRLIDAKGRAYTLEELLGDGTLAAPFHGGPYITLYLAPKDYHRVHMPVAGRLRLTRYIPGRLFSVNERTARAMPDLFARNERLVTVFDTQAGPMAVVLVGAMLVSAIETVWSDGIIRPDAGGRPRTDEHAAGDQAPALARGEEMGRFNMGSTVIVLMGRGCARWEQEAAAHHPVRVGELLATLQRTADD